MTLGAYLRHLRQAKGMTLRAVEKSSGVSNAYLSQLENGKLTNPSPPILHKLAKVYGASYQALMEKAGYLMPSRSADDKREGGSGRRKGRLPTFAVEELSEEEEEELLRYLAFIRSRKE
ncbi:MAG TPA: helix-turn-helix transcriptional regulator [Acidobacteriota bacterium]|nr:helix-turn-helix transcriptional regulator [Acidobacteriota bacterium]